MTESKLPQLADSITVRTGECNVVVISPDGVWLGPLLCDKLNAYEITRQRPIPYPLSKLPSDDVDLSDPEQAVEQEAFWENVLNAVADVRTRFGDPAIVLVVRPVDAQRLTQNVRYHKAFLLGCGYIKKHVPSEATASQRFLDQLAAALKQEMDESSSRNIRVSYPPLEHINQKYSGQNGLAAYLKRMFAQAVEAVEVFAVRENKTHDKTRAEELTRVLAASVAQLEDFTTQPKPSLKEEQMETETTDLQVVPSTSVNVDPQRLSLMIEEIRGKATIRADNGTEIEFTDQLKEIFLEDVQNTFPIITGMVRNLYETGRFFKQVKDRQKPQKLWMAYAETIGIPRRTLHTYIQVFERFGENVTQYAYLGVTKLMAVSRLKEPVRYIESRTDELVKTSTRDLIRQIIEELQKDKKVRKTKKKKKKESEPIETALQGVRLIPSKNGQVVKVIGLNKKLQETIIELLKTQIELIK